jgi:hypothetical protein
MEGIKRKKRRKGKRRRSRSSEEVLTISGLSGLASLGQEFGLPDLGLSILSGVGVATIHSAITPSYSVARALSMKPEGRVNVTQGLWIGLGLGAAATAGIYFASKKTLPTVVAGAVVLALFGVGMAATGSTIAEKLAPSRSTPSLPAPAPKPVSVPESADVV